MKHFFGIIGGMGTVATTNFLEEMNKLYRPESDQAYLNYILFNHATVPDRTAYILDHNQASPVEPLIEDIKQIESLGPDFLAIPCNTAHYFFDDLQAATDLPIINMLTLVEEALADHQGEKIGICATKGTSQSGLYHRTIERAGCQPLAPDEALQEKIMTLIYDQVKNQALADLSLYEEILSDFMDQGASAVILGCTEVSYVNSHDPKKAFPIIDAEKLLVAEVVRQGIQTQGKEANS
ncbi:amino acid racemase [Aerococcus sp. UMB1112A]|uniref:aspartate/glutamate racemase family protein n=1 Tax=Aerococcus sp. UMB1112A TaxID=3050609 RepID=UPI0025502FC2|nr:amino acid racemase [Aerococcus sp. UMB1112A]MDK8502001.1 amino acid racemase [Aerococcus sp. UMB1112A]